MRLLLLATATLALSACGSGPGLEVGRPPVLEPVLASEVLGRIKSEVANFNAFQASRINDPALRNACRGVVSFRIKSVALGLVLVNEDTSGGNIGAKVPIDIFEVGGSYKASRTRKGTLKVNMLFVPADGDGKGAQPVAPAIHGSLDEALRTMRQAMLDASEQKPCMTFPKEQKNSVEATFQVVKKKDGSFTLDFLVFSAGLTKVGSVDSSNTITIAFEAVRLNPKTGTVEPGGVFYTLRLPNGTVLNLPDDSVETAVPVPPPAAIEPPPKGNPRM